jgi:carboxypeptidase family protein
MRNPLGNSMTPLRVLPILAGLVLACHSSPWPVPAVPLVTPDSAMGAIAGAVIDRQSRDGIRSALVDLQSLSAVSGVAPSGIRADSAGLFSFSALLPGQYRVIARALGYLPLDTLCQVQRGQVDTLVLFLNRDIVGPIEVRPRHEHTATAERSRKAFDLRCG